jgi:hypothetical protein
VDSELGKWFKEETKRPEEALMAVMDGGLGLVRNVMPFHLRIEIGEGRMRAATIERLVCAANYLDVLLRNKRLLVAECLLLLVGAELCPLRVTTQRRSGPSRPCAFHWSWVTTKSSCALLRHRPLSIALCCGLAALVHPTGQSVVGNARVSACASREAAVSDRWRVSALLTRRVSTYRTPVRSDP